MSSLQGRSTVCMATLLALAACEAPLVEPDATRDLPAPAFSGSIAAAVGAEVVQPIALEVLSRAAFVDPLTMTFRLKEEHATAVVKADDPSDALVTRIVLQPGASTGWHTHPGPVIVTVVSGAVTIIDGSTCSSRVFVAGEAFIDLGQGHAHVGENHTGAETILYATFLDVPADGGPTIPAENPGC